MKWVAFTIRLGGLFSQREMEIAVMFLSPLRCTVYLSETTSHEKKKKKEQDTYIKNDVNG